MLINKKHVIYSFISMNFISYFLFFILTLLYILNIRSFLFDIHVFDYTFKYFIKMYVNVMPKLMYDFLYITFVYMVKIVILMLSFYLLNRIIIPNKIIADMFHANEFNDIDLSLLKNHFSIHKYITFKKFYHLLIQSNRKSKIIEYHKSSYLKDFFK